MVAKAQKGICAETSLHGLVLLCQVRDAHAASARLKLARVPSLAESLDERFSESLLTVVAGIGARGWDKLMPHDRPAYLSNFPTFERSLYSFAHNPYDLVFIIRSDRVDANFFAGRVLLEWFADDIQLGMEFNLFHYLDNRNLLGFHCVPDAPHGRKREQIALVDAPQQELWHKGSYLFLQHYLLDMHSWQDLAPSKQESVVGREKLSGQRLSTNTPSHADKTQQGDTPALLWQQMPSASMREQGHIDMLWSKSPQAMFDWLANRVEADEHGFSDPLLDYLKNTMSAAFFAPPLQWFEQLKDEHQA